MTVTYSLEVSTVKLAGFGRLLLRWKGGVYSLVYRELLGFAIIYYSIFCLYRLVLTEWQQDIFGAFCRYFRDFLDLIPTTFVLGFYVTFIVGRWWNIFLAIPRVENIGVMISTYVRGTDERSRMIRRGLIRYQNLMGILCFRAVSTAVKKRFPTVQHLVEANLMTQEEKDSLEHDVNQKFGNYFVPSAWFGALAAEAKKEGVIADSYQLVALMNELFNLRTNCGYLMFHDWISVPLVYTQVVTLSIYSFFAATLFGHQHLIEEDDKYYITRYFPLFTFVQFFFYMGWLKVAEVMINPLGEDDDDFELNQLIDRNVELGFMLVDTLYNTHPTLDRDPLWNQRKMAIPHTSLSRRPSVTQFRGSVANVEIPEQHHAFVSPEDKSGPIPRQGSFANAVRKLSRSVTPAHRTPDVGMSKRNSFAVDHSSENLAHNHHDVVGDSIAEADESMLTVHSIDEFRARLEMEWKRQQEKPDFD